MGTRDALGLICLDLTEDAETARYQLRRLAVGHGLDLTDTMTYRRTESGWMFRLIESVHHLGAHAVVAPGRQHVDGAELAVTGVADLIAPGSHRPYIGYGPGFVRPSRVQR
ncbi:hypothetical protein IU487_22520 [Nocardia puris]|uniref:hypothetical protein n=1 Tax=Nocardia puris TaxID=208602 RepID=UPI0018941F09|nr:hypothetical protein [Nocardia puris]MBF6213796.1 hypothetical protein [Nocardia puris]